MTNTVRWRIRVLCCAVILRVLISVWQTISVGPFFGHSRTMTWFQTLVGFEEVDSEQVRSLLHLDNETITSLKTNRRMTHGTLTIPQLSELRAQCAHLRSTKLPRRRRLQLTEMIGNVQDFHIDPANTGAVFQVASQFNLLEMIGPNMRPEVGISRYGHDKTQGPACAVACGAATIFRQYFVPVNGNIGQTQHAQLDCLHDLGLALGNEGGQLWEMRNGYALPSRHGLELISQRIAAADMLELDRLRGLLRIGVHADTEVTISSTRHLVNQLLCSALPIAYCAHRKNDWEPFARLVLEASYEATLCAAVLLMERTNCRKVYLTKIGGGAFGNTEEWIIDALRRAITLFQHIECEVIVVSYGKSCPAVRRLVQEFSEGRPEEVLT